MYVVNRTLHGTDIKIELPYETTALLKTLHHTSYTSVAYFNTSHKILHLNYSQELFRWIINSIIADCISTITEEVYSDYFIHAYYTLHCITASLKISEYP